MKNVVCIKWGEKFGSEYVNKLYNSVQRNLSLKHRFICLTDDANGIVAGVETLPIPREDLKICWNKLALFDRGIHNIEGQILFLDLDVVIVDSIDDLFLFQPESEFVSIKEWVSVDYSMLDVTPFNASAMRFNVGAFPFIVEDFYAERGVTLHEEIFFDEAGSELGQPEKITYNDLDGFPPRVFNGDQEWEYYMLRKNKIKIDYYPEGWLASYRFGFDSKAKVIVFHGTPKPEQVSDKIVMRNWR